MSELLFIPSTLSLSPSTIEQFVRNDIYFVSMLADRGHTVHCLNTGNYVFSSSGLESCITEYLAHTASTHAKITLVATELSCFAALNSLSVTSVKDQIKGLVLIDPPPVQSIRTEYGRRQILRKFASFDSQYYSVGAPSVTDSDTDIFPIPALPTSELIIHTTEGDVDIDALALKTQDEVDYYDRKLQHELYKRPAPVIRTNKHKAFYRRQLNRQASTPTNRNCATGSTQYNDNISQQDIHENILHLLESNVLSSTELLGSTIPATSSVQNIPVLVIATPFIATHAHACDSINAPNGTLKSPTNTASKISAVENIIGTITGKIESAVKIDDFEYKDIPVFDEADNWGIASATEVAHMYSPYSLQVIPSCHSLEHSLFTRRKEDSVDDDWSQEEIHTNAEIARLLDIFVRNLSL